MSVTIYKNGAWEDASSIKTYKNDAWTDATSLKVYDDGAWTEKLVPQVIPFAFDLSRSGTNHSYSILSANEIKTNIDLKNNATVSFSIANSSLQAFFPKNSTITVECEFKVSASTSGVNLYFYTDASHYIDLLSAGRKPTSYYSYTKVVSTYENNPNEPFYIKNYIWTGSQAAVTAFIKNMKINGIPVTFSN